MIPKLKILKQRINEFISLWLVLSYFHSTSRTIGYTYHMDAQRKVLIFTYGTVQKVIVSLNVYFDEIFKCSVLQLVNQVVNGVIAKWQYMNVMTTDFVENIMHITLYIQNFLSRYLIIWCLTTIYLLFKDHKMRIIVSERF